MRSSAVLTIGSALALLALLASPVSGQRGTGTGTGGGRGTGGGQRGGQPPPTGGTPQTPSKQPVFRASTELVEVDVVVVDKAGNPIHGLTRDEFVVTDRKRPQTIETFQEVRHEHEAETPTLPVTARPDVASNTISRTGRLVVLVLDDLHTFRGRSDTVKTIARKVVMDLGPESSMALIQTGGEHSVEVTDDRARLLDAIDKFQGRRLYRRPIAACDPQFIPISEAGTPTGQGCDQMEFGWDLEFYGALQGAARILGGNDHRRKAFVLVSENLAKDLTGLFQLSVPAGTAIDASSAFLSGGGAEALAAVPTQPANQHDNALLDMMEALRRGGVAVYSIDPRGEISSQKLMEECVPVWGGIDDPCLGGSSLPDWYAWPRQAQHGLEIMSEASGGFAVVNSNDFTSGIDKILSDLDNYYLLGFTTTDMKSTGYRPLDVRVKDRPDLTLRFRRGYQVTAAEAESKSKDPLAQLITGPLPKSDLPMRLHAVAMPYSSKEARVAVAMEITVPRKTMQGADQQLLDQILFGVFAVDLKGAKVRERFGWGARIALRPRPGLKEIPDSVTYEIVSSLQMPFGQYQIRASARSDKLDAGGSVYLPLDVPDFSKQALALTDLLLAYADGPHVPIAHSEVRSIVPAANLLPFDPTLDRTFSSRDTLRLYTRVLQQKPAEVTATVSALAPDGRVMLTLTRALPAHDAAPLDLKLPLQQLGSGVYRLQVKVTDGAYTAQREVAVTIK
jgi:VWFA-related protein